MEDEEWDNQKQTSSKEFQRLRSLLHQDQKPNGFIQRPLQVEQDLYLWVRSMVLKMPLLQEEE